MLIGSRRARRDTPDLMSTQNDSTPAAQSRPQVKALALDPCSLLLSEGWKEGRDQFRQYARMFYKRHDTPTRCACNDDKAGMQVCIYVSELNGRTGYEIELCGELRDGTWLKLHQWAMPTDIRAGMLTINRLLSTWEFAANTEVTRAPRRVE